MRKYVLKGYFHLKVFNCSLIYFCKHFLLLPTMINFHSHLFSKAIHFPFLLILRVCEKSSGKFMSTCSSVYRVYLDSIQRFTTTQAKQMFRTSKHDFGGVGPRFMRSNRKDVIISMRNWITSRFHLGETWACFDLFECIFVHFVLVTKTFITAEIWTSSSSLRYKGSSKFVETVEPSGLNNTVYALISSVTDPSGCDGVYTSDQLILMPLSLLENHLTSSSLLRVMTYTIVNDNTVRTRRQLMQFCHNRPS